MVYSQRVQWHLFSTWKPGCVFVLFFYQGEEAIDKCYLRIASVALVDASKRYLSKLVRKQQFSSSGIFLWLVNESVIGLTCVFRAAVFSRVGLPSSQAHGCNRVWQQWVFPYSKAFYLWVFLLFGGEIEVCLKDGICSSASCPLAFTNLHFLFSVDASWTFRYVFKLPEIHKRVPATHYLGCFLLLQRNIVYTWEAPWTCRHFQVDSPRRQPADLEPTVWCGG